MSSPTGAENRPLLGRLMGRFGAGQSEPCKREGPLSGGLPPVRSQTKDLRLEKITQSTCQSDSRRTTESAVRNLRKYFNL